MTTRSTTPRVFTSDRLFTAAFVIGVALIPHVVIGTLADWPGKPFTLHVAVVVLLVIWGCEARRRRRDVLDVEIENLQRMIENNG